MSDNEDGMDVDVPSVQFNSDNTAGKAKRPVADLPVEAEDNLPWSVNHFLLKKKKKKNHCY